ncbi:MAG: protein jag [Deltaproteobacteria bacterium]|nr:protein jag [Deltaproteobacteria bacterium]
MEDIEVSANSEEEAVALALDELGLSRDEVEVEVLKKGKTGLFGLGHDKIKVRVTTLEGSSEKELDTAAMAKEVLENLLSMMGVFTTVKLKQEGSDETETISLDVEGEDLGILIGRRSETLAALRYLVNLVVSRKLKARTRVGVDVGGYRARRYQALQALAQRLAERVKSSGRSVTMESMPADERRIVHLELRDDPDVDTQSVGQDEQRKVSIMLKGIGEIKPFE